MTSTSNAVPEVEVEVSNNQRWSLVGLILLGTSVSCFITSFLLSKFGIISINGDQIIHVSEGNHLIMLILFLSLLLPATFLLYSLGKFLWSYNQQFTISQHEAIIAEHLKNSPYRFTITYKSEINAPQNKEQRFPIGDITEVERRQFDSAWC